ncbi:hypothetical protein ES708_11984 [subsurface metagenome]
MLDLETILTFYRERMWDQPPPSTLPWEEVAKSIIVYLNCWKQARLMLIDLCKGEAVESLEHGSDAPSALSGGLQRKVRG